MRLPSRLGIPSSYHQPFSLRKGLAKLVLFFIDIFETRKKISTSEKTVVPIPDPHTAIPVAIDRLAAKYCEMMTIDGRYARPNPTP